MDTPRILSILVGKPRVIKTEAASIFARRQWSTGFFKEPVEGPVWLDRRNLAGDGQADLKNHGGIEKSVLAYAAAHYPLWCIELGRTELPHGAFGENFTIAGLTEGSVCIGDTYAVGEALLQVSQPRSPCWKISRRWHIDDLADRVKATGRTGWYLRVIKEGYVERGIPVVLADRPFQQWTVARANEVMRHRHADRHAAAELAACPLLSMSWREGLLH